MERSKMHAEAVLRMKALQDKFDPNPKILQYLEEGKLQLPHFRVGKRLHRYHRL